MPNIREVYGWTELHPNDLKTIDSCKTLVGNVFAAIAEQYGKDEAARIFAPYGKRTKRQAKLDSDMMLLWKYYDMKPRNVRKLARQLSGGDDHRRIERKLWRVIKDRDIHNALNAYLASL
jgi:hypothetical protein